MAATITEFSVSLVTNGSPGHGILLTLSGTCEEELKGLLFFDVHGTNFWKTFPVLARSFAGMILPFKLREWKWRTKPKMKHDITKFTATAVIGRYKLAHSTLLDNLESLKKKGDPQFLFEILGAKRNTVAMVAVKPSELLTSLKNFGQTIPVENPPSPNSFDDKIETYGRRGGSSIIHWARWLCFPALFTAANWYMLWNPTLLIERLPDIFMSLTTTVKDVLPLHPTDMLSAFNYGRIVGLIENHIDTTDIEQLLQKASEIAGRTVTMSDLEKLPAAIEQMEASRGIISRTYGMFSLINIFWLVSIAGICVSIGPAMWALLSPVRRLLKRVITVAWTRVIKPLIEELHAWGIFEIAGWTACLCVAADGWKQEASHADAGKLITLSGIALACVPMMGYSTLLSGMSLLNKISSDSRIHYYTAWIAATLTPLAIHRDSTLIGYFVISSLYVSFTTSGMLDKIRKWTGLKVNDLLGAVSLMSLLSCSTFIGLYLSGIKEQYLSPFRSPALVMGSITHYCTGLIHASICCCSRSEFWWKQPRMIIPLICGLATSHVGNLPGLANTSIVFGGFYVVQKYIELHDELKWDSWVLALILSGLCYKGSLSLHQNPEFVAKIFA